MKAVKQGKAGQSFKDPKVRRAFNAFKHAIAKYDADIVVIVNAPNGRKLFDGDSDFGWTAVGNMQLTGTIGAIAGMLVALESRTRQAGFEAGRCAEQEKQSESTIEPQPVGVTFC